MKKLIALLLTLTMLLCFAACGGEEAPADGGNEAPAGTLKFPVRPMMPAM